MNVVAEEADRDAKSGLMLSPNVVDVKYSSAGVSWALALLTIPGAALVMLFAAGQEMGNAGCTDEVCRHAGPDGFWFTLLSYGAPIVAVVTLALSYFTAKKRCGIAVPLIGLALLGAEAVVLSTAFGR